MLSQIPSCLFLRAVPKNSSRILANIVHTCQVGFHVDLSSTKNVMSYGPKVLLCNPQAGARDTLTSENSKDSQDPWPNDFRTNMPLDHLRNWLT